METIFLIQGVAITFGIFGLTIWLGIIAITYFLEPYLKFLREKRFDRRREWERQMEARIERLETLLKNDKRKF